MVSQRYRIDGKLGSGGMGTVWSGWDTSLQRPVAIKEVVIPPGVPAGDAQRLRDRYIREARAAARLAHPNVVAVYDMVAQPPDSDRNGGIVWTIMELVHAKDLSVIIAERRRLSPSLVAPLGLQLATALAAAHDAGVLHRDVKPANVLVCMPEGVDLDACPDQARVVLTDFGIASITGDPSLTRTGQLVGSPSYLSPERLSARGGVGAPADLWALGCTLYAATEGHPPFYGDDPFAVMTAVTSDPIPPPHHAGSLTSILRGLLDKDPMQRWDIDRVVSALQRAVEASANADAATAVLTAPPKSTVALRERPAAGHVARPPSVPQRPTPSHPAPSRPATTGRVVRPRRSRLLKFGLAVAVLAVVGIAAWMALHS
jgi:hypothetical protein